MGYIVTDTFIKVLKICDLFIFHGDEEIYNTFNPEFSKNTFSRVCLDSNPTYPYSSVSFFLHQETRVGEGSGVTRTGRSWEGFEKLFKGSKED